VDDDELDAITIESNHTIEIDSFVPREQRLTTLVNEAPRKSLMHVGAAMCPTVDDRGGRCDEAAARCDEAPKQDVGAGEAAQGFRFTRGVSELLSKTKPSG
jgi:hypothetical protein